MAQLLFIQGAGAGTHDEWDDKLVDSLRRELGDGYEIRYPRMPAEDDPSDAAWGPAIAEATAALEDGAVVVGHSVAGRSSSSALAERPPGVTTRGNRADRCAVRGRRRVARRGVRAARRPRRAAAARGAGPRVPRPRGRQGPAAHADLYARAIPQARCIGCPGAITSWATTSARWRRDPDAPEGLWRRGGLASATVSVCCWKAQPDASVRWRGSVNPNSVVSRHVAAHEPRSWSRGRRCVAAARSWETIVDTPGSAPLWPRIVTAPFSTRSSRP